MILSSLMIKKNILKLIPIRIQLPKVDPLGTHLLVLTAVGTVSQPVGGREYNVLLLLIRIAISLYVAVAEELTFV